jgi:hypothetical protein
MARKPKPDNIDAERALFSSKCPSRRGAVVEQLSGSELVGRPVALEPVGG